MVSCLLPWCPAVCGVSLTRGSLSLLLCRVFRYRAVVMERGVLATVGLLQVVFLLFHNFNGIQGNLAGFWVAALSAAMWESLIATYDLRGQGRQLLYLIIFIFL